MSTRAVIYARQSLDVAEGIDRQITRCQALAEARQYELIEQYVDNDTSATKARGAGTAWAEMLAAAEAGAFDVIVAVDLDRLLRSITDLSTIIATGARVLTVDGDMDLTTADGEFRATMLAGIARFEARRKGERQVRAIDHRLLQGIPHKTTRLLGYEVDGITPREDEAEQVRAIYRAFVHEGATLRGLSKVHGRSLPWLRQALTNARYAGWSTKAGMPIAQGAIVPLVSQEDFDTAAALLADPSRYTTTGPARKHLLSGIARCGVCGSVMRVHKRYTCTAVGTCSNSIATHIADEVAVDAVYQATQSRAQHPEERADAGDDVADLVEALQWQEDRRAAVQDLWTEPHADRVKVRRDLAAIAEEMDRLRARLDVVRSARTSAGVLDRMADLFEQRMPNVLGDLVTHHLYGEPADAWQQSEDTWAKVREAFFEQWNGLPIEQQQEWLRAALASVTILPAGGNAHLGRARVAIQRADGRGLVD